MYSKLYPVEWVYLDHISDDFIDEFYIFPKILGTRFNGNFNSYRVKVVELKKQGKEIITGG